MRNHIIPSPRPSPKRRGGKPIPQSFSQTWVGVAPSPTINYHDLLIVNILLRYTGILFNPRPTGEGRVRGRNNIATQIWELDQYGFWKIPIIENFGSRTRDVSTSFLGVLRKDASPTDTQNREFNFIKKGSVWHRPLQQIINFIPSTQPSPKRRGGKTGSYNHFY